MSTSLEVKTNAAAFNAGLQEYMRVTRKSAPEALVHQAEKFQFNLRDRLKAFAPAKGAIRAQAEAIMKNGGTIRVRPAILRAIDAKKGVSQDVKTREHLFGKGLRRTIMVNGKPMTFAQYAVHREINLRERGRFFISYASRSGKLKQAVGDGSALKDGMKKRVELLDRYRRFLSSSSISVSPNDSTVRLDWGGNESSGKVAGVLQKAREQRVIAAALRATTDDVRVYLKRKLEEADLACARAILNGR